MKKPVAFFSLAALIAASIPIPAAAKSVETDAIVWNATSCQVPAAGNGPTEKGFLIFAALATALLQPLIKAGINAIGSALEKAGAPEDLHVVGNYNTYAYTLSPMVGAPADPQAAKPAAVKAAAAPAATDFTPHLAFYRPCIAMAFGRPISGRDSMKMNGAVLSNLFGKDGTPPLDGFGNVDSHIRQQLQLAIDPSRMVIVVAELRPSTEQTAFNIVPLYVELSGSMKTDDAASKRSELLTISLLSPGAAADGTAIGARTISFLNVTTKQVLTGRALAPYTTSWIPLPSLPAGEADRVTAALTRSDDYQTATQSITNGKLKPAALTKAKDDQARLSKAMKADAQTLAGLAPITIRADLHETDDGQKLLAAIGKALADNSDKIATPIANAIDPTTSAATKESGAEKLDTLRKAAITASATVTAAKAKGDTAGAATAEIDFNAACRQIKAADYSEPTCWTTP